MPFPSSPALDRYAKTRSESRLTDFDPMEKRVDRRRFAMKSRASFSLFTAFVVLLFFFFIRLHYEHTKIDTQWPPHTSTNIDSQWRPLISTNNPDYNQLEFSGSLPRGIVESTSDMELKPLWENPRLKGSSETYTALLAIPVGIKQKQNVDIVVRKFLSENCSVILFHYDGNVDGWRDLEWSDKAIHIVAINQTKWWFAKRFLHPDVVDIYDYIFLWDEDLGVENFHAGRYLRIMISEGLEISQPALDPRRSEIHHRITVRNRTGKVHRRVYAFHGSLNCSDDSRGPPCTGWVEGMAPVFSRAAWRCVWHLIQNDLIHGWGLDMKLGYCAQGDRTKKVGVIDSEFIIHQGIPSLGGSSANKPSRRASRHGSRRASRRASRRGSSEHAAVKAQNDRSIDSRSHVRRQSTAELEMFQQRWDRAVRKDEDWIDPFKHMKRKRAAT